MYFSTVHPSPVGLLTLACDGDRLVGLWMAGQKYFGGAISEDMTERDDMPIFAQTKKWLDRYFAGRKPETSELALAPVGSDFRQCVWKILCGIPYGRVLAYGDIARKIALELKKKTVSSRAVGGAVGHNPISIIIPCHRVIGANGGLTGYSAGVGIKARLLELEGFEAAALSMPKKGIAFHAGAR